MSEGDESVMQSERPLEVEDTGGGDFSPDWTDFASVKSILDAIPDAVLVVDAGHRIVFANKPAGELFGCDALLGISVHELVPASHREKHVDYSDSYFDNPTARRMAERMNIFALSRDGREFPAEIALSPFPSVDKRFAVCIVRDITERKRTEEALRESEMRYRTLVESANDAIITIDRDSRVVVDWNNCAEHVFGYTKAEIMGQLLTILMPETYRQQHLDATKRLMSDGEHHLTTKIVERLGLRKDGSEFPMETSLFEWESGGSRFITGIARDITDKKRAEEALSESAQRYRAIVETQTELVSRFKPDTTLVFANDALCRYYGMRLDDIIGKRWFELIPEGFRDPILNDLVKITYDNPTILTETLQPVQGELKWQSWTRTGVFDGNRRLVEIQGVGRDITERKQAEEKLQRAQRETKLVLDAAGDGIYGVDTDGKVTFINPEASRLIGFKREEVLGQLGHVVIHHTRPDGAPYRREECPIYAAFKDGIARGVSDGAFWRKDGASFPVEYTSTPVFGNGGPPTGAVVVFRDISARKSAQAEMLKLQDQLAQAQKMESIGRLAGGVAHDINNVLTIIMGYSELLPDVLQDAPPDVLEQIKEIHNAGVRAKGIVGQLLAFSRKQVLDVKILDLNELIVDFQKMLGRLIGEDVELSLNLDGNLGRLVADPSQIEQVLLNLALNARDAMPTGGKIMIETANAFLDEEYSKTHAQVVPGEYVQIAVSDTGMGMDSSTMLQVFEPFFTTKEVGKGTGLGLATVYGIVKQHGGHITVYSEPGMGTTFRIYLPRAVVEAEEKEDRVVPSAATGAETILIVEDDDSVRRLAERVLANAGYTVLAASGIEETLAFAAERSGIDLLLTDVVMPGMSGPEVYKLIRQILPFVKVVFMSGYTDDVIARHGILEKGILLIQKPFTSQTLISRVREALDG